jgi:hypothetical protein
VDTRRVAPDHQTGEGGEILPRVAIEAVPTPSGVEDYPIGCPEGTVDITDRRLARPYALVRENRILIPRHQDQGPWRNQTGEITHIKMGQRTGQIVIRAVVYPTNRDLIAAYTAPRHDCRNPLVQSRGVPCGRATTTVAHAADTTGIDLGKPLQERYRPAHVVHPFAHERSPKEERHHRLVTAPFVGEGTIRVVVASQRQRSPVGALAKCPLLQDEGVVSPRDRLEGVIVIIGEVCRIVGVPDLTEGDVRTAAVPLQANHRRPPDTPPVRERSAGGSPATRPPTIPLRPERLPCAPDTSPAPPTATIRVGAALHRAVFPGPAAAPGTGRCAIVPDSGLPGTPAPGEHAPSTARALSGDRENVIHSWSFFLRRRWTSFP